jgi:hypothetical protein
MHKYLNCFRWNGRIESNLYDNLSDYYQRIQSNNQIQKIEMIKMLIKDNKA